MSQQFVRYQYCRTYKVKPCLMQLIHNVIFDINHRKIQKPLANLKNYMLLNHLFQFRYTQIKLSSCGDALPIDTIDDFMKKKKK